jgi:hypothetical protein
MKNKTGLIALTLISVLTWTRPGYADDGPYYVDLEVRTRSDFCAQILGVFRQLDKLSEMPGQCIWFKPGQDSHPNNPQDRITIEMTAIHGTIYSFYYDIPMQNRAFAFIAHSDIGLMNNLAVIGVTRYGDWGAFEKAQKDADAEQEAKHKRSAPPCMDLMVTGYATVYPNVLSQIYASQNASEALAYNPLQCETSVSGGHEYLGATIGGSQITQCKGITWLDGKQAHVLDWAKDMLRVGTEVDFDSGRRRVALFVRRRDATCRAVARKTS